MYDYKENFFFYELWLIFLLKILKNVLYVQNVFLLETSFFLLSL